MTKRFNISLCTIASLFLSFFGTAWADYRFEFDTSGQRTIFVGFIEPYRNNGLFQMRGENGALVTAGGAIIFLRLRGVSTSSEALQTVAADERFVCYMFGVVASRFGGFVRIVDCVSKTIPSLSEKIVDMDLGERLCFEAGSAYEDCSE